VEQYRVLIKPSAVKEIEAIRRKKDRQFIAQKIKQFSIDPRPHGYQKLSGQDRYRLRQGQYRIIYSKDLVVYAVKVGHRKDIYR
jgi:mRNA interferase RelE/StbE